MTPSRRTLPIFLSRSLALLALTQLALAIVLSLRIDIGGTEAIAASLGLIWLLWIAVFVGNLYLVSQGSVSNRYRDDPVWINRPDVLSRTILHFLINWSVIALTVFAGWRLPGTLLSRQLAVLCMFASIVVWIIFNIRHRRMNHARNLTISSGFSAVLFAAAYFLRGNQILQLPWQ